jgi:hypothetical protein
LHPPAKSAKISGMDKILQRLLEDNFSELAGLTVDASIPLSEQLVNEFVQSALQGNKNITDCYIAIHTGNRFAVNLKTPLWLWPLNLKVRLEKSVDFTSDPKIHASLENFALLGKLGAVFKALPKGITIQDDQVMIDVESFLATAEQRKLLDLIQSLEIRTEEASVTVDIKLEVKKE